VSAPPRKFVTAVVDDDRRVLDSLEDLLESAGHRVRLFGSAAALLESGSLADIDCLISDIDLPTIDGFELVRHADMAKRSRGAGPPCYRLFEKPIDGREMLVAVSNALGRPARGAA
jgi:DNA-binding NtrC family response regulator